LKNINSKNSPLILAVLFILISITGANAQQQPFSYTQYMDNLTPFNPAYSLLDEANSFSTVARKQWVGVDGSPETFLVNGNFRLENINSSAGMIIENDQFAIEHEIEADAYFAKAIQLGQNEYLAVSLNAGLRNYVANYSSLDANDPVFTNDVRETKPNAGFGVMVYTDWYYLGVSLPELTITSLGTASVQNNVNFKNNYYFTGALITAIDDDIKFKPAFLLSYVSGVPLLADFSGTFYLKETLGFGINYRSNNEVAGIFSINVNSFHIGYSYQFGTGAENLGGFNNATNEVSISYRFGNGSSTHKLL
jgi:type IX secretion system PorP/SprF family membrane protein